MPTHQPKIDRPNIPLPLGVASDSNTPWKMTTQEAMSKVCC